MRLIVPPTGRLEPANVTITAPAVTPLCQVSATLVPVRKNTSMKWQSAEPVLLGEHCESWQLVDHEEIEHALVFNTHKPDADSAVYYWAVKPFHGAGNVGSAKNADDARLMAEQRLSQS